jgi:2-polyprenyl-3-methyl-5-hydroxy-6-metoxy-1,4-benzoquinol methylase
MTRPQCNLCQTDHSSALFTKDSLQIVKCPECGLIYVNPQPSEEELRTIYKNGYFNGTRQADYLAEKKLYAQRFRERLKDINSLKTKGKLLDVGCAVGYFLEAARQDGWEAAGVEISSYASEVAQKSGLDVFTGRLEDAGYPDRHFDAVTLWHVLEHMRDPAACLRETHRILKDSGVLAVELPNIESKRSKKKGVHWDQLKPREHLYYFAPGTLRRSVEKAGFQVVRVSTLPKGTHIGEKLKHLGWTKIKKWLVKFFPLTRWIKTILLRIKKVAGEDDIILLYAVKSKPD